MFIKWYFVTEVNPLSFQFNGNIPKIPKNVLKGKFGTLNKILQIIVNIKK